jgi:2'-5' RNA ligase
LRTFLAAELDPGFLDAAAELGARLRAGPLAALRASWVARPALHVTLRFFGQTTAEQVDGLWGPIPPPPPSARLAGRPVEGDAGAVQASRLDAFPSAQRARVLVLDLGGAGELAAWLGDVAREAEARAVACGLAPETRPFRPHLTLARIKAPADLRAVCTETGLALPRPRVVAVTLFESKTLPSGPVYTPLRTADVTGAGSP